MTAHFPLVVFDLDGTLVDSQRDIAEAANDVLVQCGASALPESAIGRMVGDGAAVLIARAFSAAGRERPPDALERFLCSYDRRLTAHTRPYPGIPALLSALAARQTRLAVLTNKPLSATRRILAELQLSQYFPADRVLGGDGPWSRKPDPAGLNALMAATGCGPAHTCMVGDSLVDWQTAQAAGTHCCLCRYGFGFQSVMADALPPAQVIVNTPDELLSCL